MVKKQKTNLSFRYPKLFVLLATFVLAYIIFAGRDFLSLRDAFSSLGYGGAFLLGVLFVYGFTAGPATALLLLVAGEQNVVLTGLVAGGGALMGDLIIFRFVRHYFADEIKLLAKEKLISSLTRALPKTLRRYLVLVLATVIIASPLPDEIGVSMLAASPIVSTRFFSVLSFLLNTAGIFVVLLIGKSIS